MNRVCSTLVSGTMLLMGGAVAVAACEHDDSTIFVKQVLAPQLVTPGQICTFTSDPTQAYITSGILDDQFAWDFQANLPRTDGYSAEFLVGNQLVPQGNPTTPTTETSFVNIQGATVKVTDSDGNTLNNFTRLTASTISPASGGTPSYAPFDLLIVDTKVSIPKLIAAGKLGNGAAARVVTFVQFFGKTLGGDQVESNTFEFPVDICDGCLVSFSATDIKYCGGLVNCLGAGSATSTTQPVPCSPGQDLPIDCSQCQGLAVCNPNADICANFAPGAVTDAGTP